MSDGLLREMVNFLIDEFTAANPSIKLPPRHVIERVVHVIGDRSEAELVAAVLA